MYFSQKGCLDVKMLPTSFLFPVESIPTESVSTVATEPNTEISTPVVNSRVNQNFSHTYQQKKVCHNLSSICSKNLQQVHLINHHHSLPYSVHRSNSFQVKSHTRHTPIPVPYHWREDIKASLSRGVARVIFTPVPIGKPLEWCSNIIIPQKKDGKTGRPADLQRLKSSVKSFCLPDPSHIPSKIITANNFALMIHC